MLKNKIEKQNKGLVVVLFIGMIALSGCGGGETIDNEKKNEIDTKSPSILEVSPIETPTINNKPSYTFSSDEAGTITYGGSCSSSIETAMVGDNTIILNELVDGVYNDCTISVKDSSLNVSNTITISEFEVNTIEKDTKSPSILEVSPIETPTRKSTPSYTFSSDEAGTITYGGSCSSTITTAIVGDNTIILNELVDGVYNDCTILVKDFSLNVSNELTISEFEVDSIRRVPLLIIRIEWDDYTFENPSSTWNQKIFGVNEGQLNNYFDEVSNGYFQFEKVNEDDGMNDGIITVKLNENHPGQLRLSLNTSDRLVNALKLTDEYIDYSIYDTNNDSKIGDEELQIMFLVAGGEKATGIEPGVWAHAHCMPYPYGGETAFTSPKIDNMWLSACGTGGYSVFGEKHGGNRDASIGVIAHELGHAAFDLPDLYDTEGSSYGIGRFGLMANGTWAYKAGDTQIGQTPVHMTGWSKVESGFITPTIIDQSVLDLNVNSTTSIDYGVYKIPTNVDGEYFLVENRGNNGYDRGLYRLTPTGSFEGGLSILHIDDNINSNQDEAHKKVDIEEADNSIALDSKTGLGNYHSLFFAGSFDSFTPETTPSSNTYTNGSSGISVINVSNPGNTMTIDIEIN